MSKTTANGNFLVRQFSSDEGSLCLDWHSFLFFYQGDCLMQGRAVQGCIRHNSRAVKISDCKPKL